MNKSLGVLSQPVSVESPGSRASTVSSVSFDDYDDQPEETQESSWATYTDEVDRQQRNKIFISDSFIDEDEETYGEVSRSAKTFDDQCRKNILKNRMIVKMKNGVPVVDGELEDTASSPHSSPTVSFMNQLNMMKLKNNSKAQEKMVMQGKPVQKTEINSNKERSELEK